MASGLYWIEMLSLFLIVLGALNWGVYGVLGFNIVAWLASITNSIVEPIIYVIIGIAAIIHMFSRDFYLPFLGQAVYPCGSLAVKSPLGADTTITVKVQPNVNVIYWAAEPNAKVVDSPWLAYSEYENTGVARSDSDGYATLKVRRPAQYKIPNPMNNTLRPHVHYRTCSMAGMLSRVETAFL